MADKAAKFSRAFLIASSRDWLLGGAVAWGSDLGEVISCLASFSSFTFPILNTLVSWPHVFLTFIIAREKMMARSMNKDAMMTYPIISEVVISSS